MYYVGMKTVLFGSTGRRLKIMRSDLGLNIVDVARLVGDTGVKLSASALSRFERDEVSPPGDVLAGLARVLGTSADYLVLLTDDPLPRAEAGDARMLSLLEEVAVAYEVDRDVDRLLRLWGQLEAEDRRLLLQFVERLYAARPRVVGG